MTILIYYYINNTTLHLSHYTVGHKGNEMEFTAYRVLYYVYLQGNRKYTAGSMDLAHLMSSLSAEAYRYVLY